MYYVHAMTGLGDNIYTRPYIKALAEKDDVAIITHWPEVYDDIKNIKFLQPAMDEKAMRVQTYNASNHIFEDVKGLGKKIHYRYAGNRNPIWNCFDNQHPHKEDLTSLVWDMPEYETIDIDTDKPIAFIRPPVVRKEWANTARNNDPKYLHQAIEILRDAGYFIISAAYVEEGKEWIEGGPYYADLRIEDGSLTTRQLLGLFLKADISVGSVGWNLPASIAANKPGFIIFGGAGMYNGIHYTTDPRMDLNHFGYAVPDEFCMCNKNDHNCKKTISNFETIFKEWLEK